MGIFRFLFFLEVLLASYNFLSLSLFLLWLQFKIYWHETVGGVLICFNLGLIFSCTPFPRSVFIGGFDLCPCISFFLHFDHALRSLL